jgi:hypothetical protein
MLFPSCRLVGRLAAGATRAQTLAEISTLQRSLRPDETAPARPLWLTGTSRIEAPIGRALVMPFLIAQVAVGAIFLLACLNVANLTLARALARDREFAIRMSLGVGRGRDHETAVSSEGLLLAGAAALAILSVTPLLLWIAGLSDEMAASFGPDAGVIAYATGAALLAGLVCGLIPTWQERAPEYLAWLATGLAALALILAATGVYGVFAHGVESRRKEIGIRIALGARANMVVVAVVRSNTRSFGCRAGSRPDPRGAQFAGARQPVVRRQPPRSRRVRGRAARTAACRGRGKRPPRPPRVARRPDQGAADGLIVRRTDGGRVLDTRHL